MSDKEIILKEKQRLDNRGKKWYRWFLRPNYPGNFVWTAIQLWLVN